MHKIADMANLPVLTVLLRPEKPIITPEGLAS